MVLNLTDPNGLESIFKWYDQLQKVKQMPVVITANKSDLVDKRKISEQDLVQLKSMTNLHVIETSALTGHNVFDAYHCLIYQVLKPCLIL